MESSAGTLVLNELGSHCYFRVSPTTIQICTKLRVDGGTV